MSAMHLTIRPWLEVDLRAGSLFIRCWPFGQIHWSRLGIFMDRWATLRRLGEVS